MTQSNLDEAARDCIFGTILGFTLPFYLAAAAGNPEIAKAAIQDLIAAYTASTAIELDLVGRIIGFSAAASDNLRLSMTPGMSDVKVLRYRCNAVTLSRASIQAQKMLEAMQAKQEQTRNIPRPSVAAAPTPPVPTLSAPPLARVAHPPRAGLSESLRAMVPVINGGTAEFAPFDIETLKREARIMMAAFSRDGAPGSVTLPPIPDQAAIAEHPRADQTLAPNRHSG
jgi:hypothetical protein